MGHSEQKVTQVTMLILQGHELLACVIQGMNEARNTIDEEAKFCDHATAVGAAIHKLRDEVERSHADLLKLSANWPTLTCAEVAIAEQRVPMLLTAGGRG